MIDHYNVMKQLNIERTATLIDNLVSTDIIICDNACAALYAIWCSSSLAGRFWSFSKLACPKKHKPNMFSVHAGL